MRAAQLAGQHRPSAGPAVVRTDAQSAIDALHGPVIAQRLRHIDIRMHRTRQAIDDGDITIRSSTRARTALTCLPRITGHSPTHLRRALLE
jgi:hypothetical protein